MVRWIIISGVDEVGRNCHLLETDNEMYVVDCGVKFGSLLEPGVDYVIPDLKYIIDRAKKLKGIVLSHAHEDHIGGLPYLLRALKGRVDSLRIYGAPLTLEFVKEYLNLKYDISIESYPLYPREEINLGKQVKILPIHVNHSIPHALALAFKTSDGTIIYTGDFKIDQNHPTMDTTDLFTFAKLGEEGVQLLLSDSTNADEPGFGTSEMKVREGLESVFSKYGDKRIIVSVFASHVSRIELVLSLAKKYGRVVAVDGKGIVKITELAKNLGFLADYDDVMVSLNELLSLPPKSQLILSTGTQGEPLSALTRMAYGKHRFIKLNSSDVVVISADPIPGNERAVFDVINQLFRIGVEVVYSEYFLVHASGHASREELRLILNLVKPTYFIPIHGERRQLVAHANIASETHAVDEKNIFMLERGDALLLEKGEATLEKNVASSRDILVSGKIADLSQEVVEERYSLARNGLILAIFNLDRKNRAKLYDLIMYGVPIKTVESDYMKFKQYVSSTAGELVPRPDLTIIQKERLMAEKIISKLASTWGIKPNVEVRIVNTC